MRKSVKSSKKSDVSKLVKIGLSSATLFGLMMKAKHFLKCEKSSTPPIPRLLLLNPSERKLIALQQQSLTPSKNLHDSEEWQFGSLINLKRKKSRKSRKSKKSRKKIY